MTWLSTLRRSARVVVRMITCTSERSGMASRGIISMHKRPRRDHPGREQHHKTAGDGEEDQFGDHCSRRLRIRSWLRVDEKLPGDATLVRVVSPARTSSLTLPFWKGSHLHIHG